MRGLGSGLTKSSSVVIAVMLLASADMAYAQNSAAPAGEGQQGEPSGDIVVTAQKRSERLQDVPVSIAAVSGDSLRNMGAAGYTDYLNSVPSVSYTKNGGYKDKIFIRGLSDTMSSRVTSTTGIYLDETPITEVDASLGDIGTFDIDRIEVLRGPQGTLFGSASMGGTVRVITNKPKLDRVEGVVDGQLTGTAHGGTNYEVDGMVNLPIVTDKVGLRVVAGHRRDSGFIDNIATGPVGGKNVNDNDLTTLRAQASLELVDNLSILLGFQWQKATYHSNPNEDVALGDYEVKRFQPEVNRFNAKIYTATIDYRLPFATITSATSLIDKDNFSVRDLTDRYLTSFQTASGLSAPNQGYGLAYIFPNKSFVQELRATSTHKGPFHWVVGLYYNNFYPNQRQYAVTTLEAAQGFNYSTFALNYRRKEYAAFGDLSFDLTPKLQITVGARTARFEISQSGFTSGTQYGGPVSLVNPPDVKQNTTVGKFRAQYKMTKDNMIYALAAQGYRPGGTAGPFATACQAQLTSLGYGAGGPTQYNPDKLWNYELGSKNEFFGGKLTFNADAYYIDWKQTQVAQNLQCGSQFISNAGGARVKGVELETRLRPVRGLELAAGGAFTDATFTSTDTTIRTRDGAQLPNAPKWTFNGSADYGWNVGGRARAYLHADVQYVSSRYSDLPLATTNHLAPAYTLANLRAGIALTDWDFSVFARNIGDTKAILNIVDASNQYYNTINTPRTVGVQVRRSF